MKKMINKFLPLSFVALVAAGLTLSTTKIQFKRVLAGEIGDYGDATKMQSMTFFGDTRTQMGFCWTTDNATNSDLQVVEKTIYDNTNGFGDNALSSDIKYYTGTMEPSLISGDGFIHRAIAKRLKPDTEYVYRFGDEQLNRWCEIGTFKTAADSNRNFTFMHISDPQGDNELHYESYHQLLTDSTTMFNPEWIALTGDITDDSQRPTALAGFLDEKGEEQIVELTAKGSGAYRMEEAFVPLTWHRYEKFPDLKNLHTVTIIEV